MSIFQTKDGILKTAAVALSGTSATTIVDGGNTGCTIEWVTICEVAGSTPTVILDIYRGGVAYKIKALSQLTKTQAPIVLKKLADKLAEKAKAQSNTLANDLDDEIPY